MSKRLFLPTIVLLGVSVTIAPRTGRAQPQSLSGARIHPSVEIDPRGIFLYRYTVENGAASTTGVWKMTVDVSMPGGASTPSATGLVNGSGYFAEPSAPGRNPRRAAAVPVGLSAPQSGWRTTVGSDAAARWVAINDTGLILPKQRLAGFSIESHGPPSVRRFTLVPRIDPDRAPVMAPGDDPGEADRYQQDLDHYIESRSVTGMTLAPSALVKVTADEVLTHLVSQIAQARSSRWISSDASTRSLTDKLQAARAAISRRQMEGAGNILRGLRAEVAAQSAKTLTSDAVTLVDVNIQYALRLAANP